MNSANRYDELIVRYLDGFCTSEETQILLSWLAESEGNRAHFESFKSVWELTAFELPEALDVEAALATVNGRIEAVEAEKQETAVPVVKATWLQRNYKYVSCAAAVAVVMVMSLFFLKPFDNEMILASNEVGINTPCSLPDGTTIVFDGPSKLSYKKSFGKSKRAVNFEGVARFDVAKDSEKPFVIHCDDMQVEVLGTSFLISTAGDAQIVDLYTGKVRMCSIDKKGNELESLEILPGDRAVFQKGNHALERVSALDVKKEELMMNHELVFNDERLKVIVETVEYIYDVNINLAVDKAEKRITVRFGEESIGEVLETLSSVADLELTISGSTYILR